MVHLTASDEAQGTEWKYHNIRKYGMQSYGCIALIVAGEDPKAEVTRMENIVVLVDTKKGTMRAGKNLSCGWYQIGEGGVEPWIERPRNI